MKEAKVLFIAQEITPYLPESEIANICRNLPQGIQYLFGRTSAVDGVCAL